MGRAANRKKFRRDMARRWNSSDASVRPSGNVMQTMLADHGPAKEIIQIGSQEQFMEVFRKTFGHQPQQEEQQ
jgi:hypothetical protein